ncbi:hypothetical protein H8D83_02295 [Candidatus Woesearchaeota archaeon]|nr:hypothetical protein [Candidatus Woesearchaeota archaeon]MBL7050683.1 hypothetical protein [Candidatus Woesearchaeota archaeon]
MAMYPKRVKAAQFRVKFKDNFHLKNLYYLMHEWLVQEEWATRSDKDFPEIFNGQNESALGGTEAWFVWRPTKAPTKTNYANSNYYRWEMNISGHVILLRSVEVMKDGKKFKTNWGEIEILIDSWVVTDYKKEWENHPFLKHISDVFRSRLFKKQIVSLRDQLHRETYRFREAIKDYLEMRMDLPESESQGEFFPRKGIGE